MAAPLFLDIVPRATGVESAASSVVASMKAAGSRAGSAFSAAFGSETKSASGVVAGLTRDAERQAGQLERISARIQKAKQAEYDILGKQRVATVQLTEATEKYGSESSKTAAAEERLARVQRQRTNVAEQITRMTAQQETANKALTASSVAAANQTSTLNTATAKLGGTATMITGSMKGLGVGMLAGFGFSSITSGFRGVIQDGNDFTVALNTLRASAQATGDQMAQVSAKARQLANDAGLPAVSAKTATEAMLELSKGGFSVQQAMDAARGTLALAAAAGVEAGDAAAIQANALQAFGEKASYAATAADILANADIKSSGSIKDLALGLQQAGTVAHGFGVSMGDTVATLALFANAGIQGSDAGTLFKSSLLALTDQGKPAQAAIKELGLAIYDQNHKFVGMRELWDQLSRASKRMSQEQFQAATNTLFGSDAIRNAMVAAGGGAKSFDSMRAALNRMNAAQELANTKNEDLPGQYQRLGNAIDDAKLAIYDLIKAPLATVLEKTTTAATLASNAMRDHKGLVQGVGGAVLGLATAWVTIKAAQGIWSGLSTVVGGASSTIRGVAAAARFTGSAVTSTASGVANIATSARDYWNWTGKAKAQAVGDFAATKAAAARDAVASAGSWVAGGVRSASAWAATQAKAAASFVAIKAAAARDAAASAASWVASNARAAASFVATRAALLAQTIATRAAAVAQAALNLAMRMNPIGLIITAIVALVAGVVMMYRRFEWFRNAVNAVWKFIWENVIRPIIGYIKLQIEAWATVIRWLYNNVMKPVFDAIGRVWNWLYDNVIKPVVGFIKLEIEGWAKIFNWIHDSVIKPVGDKIGTVMSGIKDAFTNAVNWVKDQWSRITDIVKAPAKFVIDVVYNKGIVPLWNGIASVFSLNKINAVDTAGFSGGGVVPDASKYAGGGVHRGAGVVAGYQPGRDIVNAVLSPGESVLVPEATRAIGPANILRLNKMFSGRPSANGNGVPMFAGGGLFGWVKDAVGSVTDWVGDPVGKIKSLFKPWVDKATGAAGGSEFGKAIASTPSRMLDAAVAKVKDWVSSAASAMGGGNGDMKGVKFSGPDMVPIVQNSDGTWTSPNPSWAHLMRRESGGNARIVQQIQDVNSGGNEASGLFQIAKSTWASYGGLAYAPTAGQAAPQDQARVAARIFKAQGGAPWGSGLPGRETDSGLAKFGGGGILLRQVIPFEGGGVMVSDAERGMLAGGTINTSMWEYIKSKVPGAQLNNSYRAGDGGYHGIKQALDVVGPGDVMQQVAEAAFAAKDQFAQIIWNNGPVWYNVRKNQLGTGVATAEGAAARAIYTESTMAGHADHVHLAAEGLVAGAKPISDGASLSGAAADSATAGAMTGGTAGATTGGTAGATSGVTLDADTQQQVTRLEQQITTARARSDQLEASVKESEASAAKSDADAKAAKTPQARDKLVATAARQRAQARKYQSDLEIQKQKITAWQAKIDELKSGSSASSSAADSATSGSTSTSETSTGVPMTWNELGSRAGGIAADGIVETLGLGDTLLGDPTKSPLIKAPLEVANAFIKNPPKRGGGVSTAPGTKSGTATKSAPAPGKHEASGGGPLVNIEKWISSGSTAEDSRRLGREMRSHQGGMRR